MRWSVQELLRDCAHPFAGAPLAISPQLVQTGTREIAGVSIDTRSLVPGSLFVPLVAARDGHDFLPSAVQKGAGAVLIDRPHQALAATLPPEVTAILVQDTQDTLTRLAAAQSSPAQPRICITGSNGKTTTRALLGAVLRCQFSAVQETAGNLNNHLGVPLTLLGEPHQPDARLIEFGMSALEENRHLSRIFAPTIGVVTSIALEHLEFMGSLANIAQAEAEPVHDLPDGALLTIPYGEPVLETALKKIEQSKALRIVRVGYSQNADVQVRVDRIDERTRGQIHLPGQAPIELALPIIGAHNLLNAAYALVIGQDLNIPIKSMVQALESTQSVGSRGKILRWGPHRLIADCYNANPGSMKAALESLAHTDPERARIAVLGDMFELGPSTASLHLETMQNAAAQKLDAIFAIGPLSTQALLDLAPSELQKTNLPSNIEQAARDLTKALDAYPQGATVLFKASRGMKLEALLQALTQSS